MIDKSTCKLFYLHIINTNIPKPIVIQKWSDHYLKLNMADSKVWKRIFNSVLIQKETQTFTFQYIILHEIIPCQKWLHTIKIK